MQYTGFPMRSSIAIIQVLFFSILLVSCSTTSKYYPVNNTAPRISSLGFYISPPPGDNWYERHYQDSLFYFKNTKENNFALTTQATELFISDDDTLEGVFLSHMKERAPVDSNRKTILNSSLQYTRDQIASSQCIRYQRSYHDYGHDKKGRYPYVKIFNKGLVCRHPDSPKVGIDVSYMEKSYPMVPFTSYRNEGEVFISSLSFFQTSRN